MRGNAAENLEEMPTQEQKPYELMTAEELLEVLTELRRRQIGDKKWSEQDGKDLVKVDGLLAAKVQKIGLSAEKIKRFKELTQMQLAAEGEVWGTEEQVRELRDLYEQVEKEQEKKFNF